MGHQSSKPIQPSQSKNHNKHSKVEESPVEEPSVEEKTLYLNIDDNTYYKNNTYTDANKIENPNFPEITTLYVDYNGFTPLYNSIFTDFTNLKKLIFSDTFNTYLVDAFTGSLDSLEEITFGKSFNKRLNKSLNSLKNLKKLTFGDGYNDGFLHNNSNKFPHIQDDIILEKLKELTFGKFFKAQIGDKLNNLNMLEKLTINVDYFEQIELYKQFYIKDNVNSIDITIANFGDLKSLKSIVLVQTVNPEIGYYTLEKVIRTIKHRLPHIKCLNRDNCMTGLFVGTMMDKDDMTEIVKVIESNDENSITLSSNFKRRTSKSGRSKNRTSKSGRSKNRKSKSGRSKNRKSKSRRSKNRRSKTR